jgi:hypothetical protein
MADAEDLAVFDGAGRVRVRAERCPVCPFGQPEHAGAGFADRVRRALERGGILACAEAARQGQAAVCRGFTEGYARLSPLLGYGRSTAQIAEVPADPRP